MNDFMKGRNGADELTIVMGFAGIVIAMIGSMARIQWLSWIAIAVIVIGVLRGLSKNIDARRKENDAFVTATANVPASASSSLAWAAGLRPQTLRVPLVPARRTLSAPSERPRRCGRVARPRPTSSAPTAARCCPSPRARARSASPAPSATPRWRRAPSRYTIGQNKSRGLALRPRLFAWSDIIR